MKARARAYISVYPGISLAAHHLSRKQPCYHNANAVDAKEVCGLSTRNKDPKKEDCKGGQLTCTL